MMRVTIRWIVDDRGRYALRADHVAGTTARLIGLWTFQEPIGLWVRGAIYLYQRRDQQHPLGYPLSGSPSSAAAAVLLKQLRYDVRYRRALRRLTPN